MESILLGNSPDRLYSVYNKEILEDISTLTSLEINKCYTKDFILQNPKAFKDTQYIFSTWGMPIFDKEEIREFFPSLKHIFYAAGSVQSFAKPFMDCEVSIHSAYMANAIPVTEYTVSQIILANKGFFLNCLYQSSGQIEMAMELRKHIKGTFGCNVGIIGAGAIGKKVISMLNQSYNVNILVFDPFLDNKSAEAMNVQKTTLLNLFSQCNVISNHLADNLDTKNMINYECFNLMGKYSVFLNTGRGAQVVEEDLIKALIEDQTRCAVLDVTFPEPPLENSAFYSLPNVFLTSHIAGSMGDELYRMSSYMLDEFRSALTDKKFNHLITKKMLKTMA